MLNLPNAITLTRIALVVVFTAAVSVADRYSWGYLAALVTFILSAGLWYGIGSWDFTKRRQGLLGNIRNLIRTHKLERQLIHYHGKQESIS